MSKAQFTIAYDGPALREGRMEVRELAPALMAVGQLFDAANAALNGDAAKVSVHVVATNTGSFEISLEVIQSLAAQITGLLVGEHVTAAANLVGLITGAGVPTGAGVFWLIKRLRGHRPEKINRQADQCTLVFHGESFVVPLQVMKLYQDVPLRRAVKAMVAPLTREGISDFSFREDGEVILPVTLEDIPSFEEPEVAEEVLIEQVIVDVFTIVSLAFKEDNKWRLNDGNATISAMIDDDDFLRRVDENLIAFAKGDILKCRVHVRKTRSKDAIRTEYVVQQVIEHKPSARQFDLGLDR